jgi:hypothetical protein
MKLYKYRSLEKLDYVFDILSNGLVYCSSYKDLNDPFEGQFKKLYSNMQFGSSQWGDGQCGAKSPTREDLDKHYTLHQKRICSFSLTNTDVKMWSYYADSHKGICIEFDIDENEMSDFYTVDYNADLKRVKSIDIDENIATNILKRKTKQWDFECEVRLITEKEKYNLKKNITSVILGNRISELNEGIINLIRGGIPMQYAKLTDDLKIEVKDYR